MTVTATSDHTLLGRRGRPLALALGGLVIAMAILVVAVVPPAEQDPDDLYPTAWHVVRDVGLLALLLGTITVVEMARRRDLTPAIPARLIQAGYALLAAGVIAGLVLQEDPGWFFVVAGPGLLASAFGFVWWAVGAYRRRTFPTWATVLLGVGGLTAIALAEFGTSVLMGSFWLYLGSARTLNGAR